MLESNNLLHMLRNYEHVMTETVNQLHMLRSMTYIRMYTKPRTTGFTYSKKMDTCGHGGDEFDWVRTWRLHGARSLILNW